MKEDFGRQAIIDFEATEDASTEESEDVVGNDDNAINNWVGCSFEDLDAQFTPGIVIPDEAEAVDCRMNDAINMGEIDFASALAGDDVEIMKKMQQAVKKGYDMAQATWGGALPEICQKTLEATNKLFDDYYASKENE